MPVFQITTKIGKIYFKKDLFHELIETCRQRYPQYVRGLFSAKEDPLVPHKIYFFNDNLRLREEVFEDFFESFGPYYKKHKGFVANPIELATIENEINKNKEIICGIFHVHIDFPACPTKLDIETFSQTVLATEDVWYLIISFLMPETPDIRAFWIINRFIYEIEITYEN